MVGAGGGGCEREHHSRKISEPYLKYRNNETSHSSLRFTLCRPPMNLIMRLKRGGRERGGRATEKKKEAKRARRKFSRGMTDMFDCVPPIPHRIEFRRPQL